MSQVVKVQVVNAEHMACTGEGGAVSAIEIRERGNGSTLIWRAEAGA
jgi:hypothetical protein